MIEEVVFTTMVPILDGKYTRQDRFGVDEGWTITVDNGAGSATLARTYRANMWPDVPPFTVVGVPFVYRERSAPPAAEPAPADALPKARRKG